MSEVKKIDTNMDGYWAGGNHIIEMIFYVKKEQIYITLPSEDMWNKEVSIKKFKKNSLKFIFYSHIIEVSKVNSEILYGCVWTIEVKNSIQYVFFKKISEIEALSYQPVNRMQELEEGKKYLNEVNCGINFQYPDIKINDYYLRLKDIISISNLKTKDEFTRIKIILSECSNLLKHNGQIILPNERSSLDLISYSKNETKGELNCRGLALILTDLFIAYGFKARNITCIQRERNFMDSHVCVIVYSYEYTKWIYVDPCYNLIIYDRNKIPLSLEEIREYIIDKKYLLASEEARYRNISLDFVQFLETFKKKIYRFLSPEVIFPGHDNLRIENEIELLPAKDFLFLKQTTSNPQIFWAAPKEKNSDKHL